MTKSESLDKRKLRQRER